MRTTDTGNQYIHTVYLYQHQLYSSSIPAFPSAYTLSICTSTSTSFFPVLYKTDVDVFGVSVIPCNITTTEPLRRQKGVKILQDEESTKNPLL